MAQYFRNRWGTVQSVNDGHLPDDVTELTEDEARTENPGLFGFDTTVHADPQSPPASDTPAADTPAAGEVA